MDDQQDDQMQDEGARNSGVPVFDNLRIHMVHGDTSKTAAFVSCKILTAAGALFLNSMALVRGANGLYLSFPSRKRDGQPVKGFEDYYYMERGLKEMIQASAIEEFKKKCEEVGLDPEKATAPLAPGMGGADDDEHQPPRDFQPREFQPRQNFSNGPSGGRNNGGGGYGGDRGGYNNGGGYGDRGGRSNGGGGYGGGYNNGGGGGYGANRGGGGYGGGDRGGYNNGGGGGYGANRGGGYNGAAGGERNFNTPSNNGGYNNDRGNRAGYGNGNSFQGPMAGPGQSSRPPLSNRFNPYTGMDNLTPEKGPEVPKKSPNVDPGNED